MYFSLSFCSFLCVDPRFAGVKTEEIRKGRILAGLRDIWKVFLEILPLQNSKEKKREKPEKNQEEPKKKLRQISFSLFFLVVLCFEPRIW